MPPRSPGRCLLHAPLSFSAKTCLKLRAVPSLLHALLSFLSPPFSLPLIIPFISPFPPAQPCRRVLGQQRIQDIVCALASFPSRHPKTAGVTLVVIVAPPMKTILQVLLMSTISTSNGSSRTWQLLLFMRRHGRRLSKDSVLKNRRTSLFVYSPPSLPDICIHFTDSSNSHVPLVLREKPHAARQPGLLPVYPPLALEV